MQKEWYVSSRISDLEEQLSALQREITLVSFDEEAEYAELIGLQREEQFLLGQISQEKRHGGVSEEETAEEY